jgi:hypothetical protein
MIKLLGFRSIGLLFRSFASIFVVSHGYWALFILNKLIRHCITTDPYTGRRVKCKVCTTPEALMAC